MSSVGHLNNYSYTVITRQLSAAVAAQLMFLSGSVYPSHTHTYTASQACLEYTLEQVQYISQAAIKIKYLQWLHVRQVTPPTKKFCEMFISPIMSL